MDKFSIYVPSKTFLAGEYLTLIGGPAILLNTSPPFKITITEKNTSINKKKHKYYSDSPFIGLDKKSPLFYYLKSNKKIWNKFNINFEDPYQGLGGFGASSAIFVAIKIFELLYSTKSFAFSQFLTQIRLNPFIWLDFLTHYEKIFHSKHKQKFLPSGVDMISQAFGKKIVFFHKNKLNISHTTWKFNNLDFILVHTNNKIKTHLHLQKIKDLSFVNSSQVIIENIWKSLINKDEYSFISYLKKFNQFLFINNLVSKKTINLIKIIHSILEVKVIKGCGALGSDVLLIIAHKKDLTHIVKTIKKKTELNVKIISTSQNLINGTQVKYEK